MQEMTTRRLIAVVYITSISRPYHRPPSQLLHKRAAPFAFSRRVKMADFSSKHPKASDATGMDADELRLAQMGTLTENNAVCN